MLEFFAIATLAEHMKNKKEEEDARMKEYFNQGQEDIRVVISKQPMNLQAINLIAGVLALVIGLFTARLAYNCNAKSDPVVRILALLFGFFFSGLYLIYYFLRYVLLGQKC
jgi:hypothetical protein